jgi:hypothetical protein
MSVLEHSLTNTDFYILPAESKGFSIYVNGSQVESLGDYYPTIEEAKAAAQAHFEQIVLSYLE